MKHAHPQGGDARERKKDMPNTRPPLAAASISAHELQGLVVGRQELAEAEVAGLELLGSGRGARRLGGSWSRPSQAPELVPPARPWPPTRLGFRARRPEGRRSCFSATAFFLPGVLYLVQEFLQGNGLEHDSRKPPVFQAGDGGGQDRRGR